MAVDSLVEAIWNVLVVDSDENSLLDLEKVLEDCNHIVTKCKDADKCMEIIREKKADFHLVMIDAYVPTIGGFELSRLVRVETDIPIILMSSTYSNVETVRKALGHGASDYLLKPINGESIKRIDLDGLRAHAYAKSALKQEWKEEEHEVSPPNSRDTGGNLTTSDEQDVVNKEALEKRKGESVVGLDQPPRKKQRVIWSHELHGKFVAAIDKFGLERAVPKKIMEVMNVPGITRENVASHLQKYRQFKRKQQGDTQKKEEQAHQPRRQHESKAKEAIPHPKASTSSQPNTRSEVENFTIGSQQAGFQASLVDQALTNAYETHGGSFFNKTFNGQLNPVHFMDNVGFVDTNDEFCLPLHMIHDASVLFDQPMEQIVMDVHNHETYDYDSLAAGLPLMPKIEEPYQHSDIQFVQDPNLGIYQDGQATFYPNDQQPTHQHMFNSGYNYDPAAFFFPDQINQPGLLTDQLNQDNEAGEFCFKDCPQDKLAGMMEDTKLY